MSVNDLKFHQQTLRGTDSNSLLRIYDLAKEMLKKPLGRQQLHKADTAVRRIASELERRNVRFTTGNEPGKAAPG